MKPCLIIPFFLFSSLFSFSQESKIDSVNIIKTSRIIPSTKKYIQYIENLDGTIIFNSILTREIQETQYDEKSALLIIQKYQSEKGIDIDSSFVDNIYLKPIAYHTDISTEGHKEIVEFSENQITNRIIFADSVSYSTKFNNHFYNGVITNDIISELPLELGKVFNINMVNPGKRFYEYITSVKVLGIETVELNPSMKIKCWKLNVKFGNSNNGTSQWYSFDNQIQIKSLFEFGNGKKFIRTMIIQ
jgi:hypothetical protein